MAKKNGPSAAPTQLVVLGCDPSLEINDEA
jgi:hypothetical protein